MGIHFGDIVLAALMVVLAETAGFAAASNVEIKGQTSTQAVISFSIPDPAHCTVQLFTDPQRTQAVNDTNETLFPGSANCARPGSAVQGSHVTFVAGARTSQAAASDDRMYSRALAVLTTYYYRITDTNDGQHVDGSLSTANIPWGNLYPEQPPFDAKAWDNRAYPQMDWTPQGRDKVVIDPLTGLRVKRMSGPGDAFASKYSTEQNSTPNLAAAVDSSQSCSDAGNLVTAGASFAKCSGAMNIFLPLPVFSPRGGGSFQNWKPVANVDDLILYVYGSATAINAGDNSDKISVCLAQGADLPCLSQTFTGVLKATASGTGTLKIPSATPVPAFANWGYTPLHGDVAPPSGTVAVNNSTVTLTNPNASNTFANAFNVTWPAGSRIFIAGSAGWSGTPCANNYCTVAGVDSAVQLRIEESCDSDCPASAAYEGRAFGFKVTRQGTSGSVLLSFGWENDQSLISSVLEDATPQHCSHQYLTVTNDAQGQSYNGYSLQGQLCAFGGTFSTTYYLFISKDQNGNPLGEMRPLGEQHLPYPVAWNSNGASFPHGVELPFAGWDPQDGNSFYSIASYDSGKSGLIVHATYDPNRYPACNPPYKSWPGYLDYVDAFHFFKDACFTYTNLTDPTANPPMDIRSQIVRAYATYNPSVDISGFVKIQSVYAGGYVRSCLAATGGGDRALNVCGSFNGATGALVQVFDSFSRYPGRWGYVHGPIGTSGASGAYHSLTLDMPYAGSANPAFVLYGPFEMAVTAVNRAGTGETPIWTTPGSGSGTAIASQEAYTCPSDVDPRWAALGATGQHCIQVEVSSEPCSHTPGSAAIYPGGKNEAQQFPCTSTDGSTVINPAWSKLQNLAEGDWLRRNQTYNDYDEMFIVAKKEVISNSEIRLWLIRGHGVFPNGIYMPYGTRNSSHPDGFSLAAAASFALGAANWTMDAEDVSTTWIPDNPAIVLIHGAQGAGSAPANRTLVSYDLQTQTWYASLFDLPRVDTFMQPLVNRTVKYPAWAGSTAHVGEGTLQTYMDYEHTLAPGIERKWVVNYRHLNPSLGSGAEFRTGMGPYTMTGVPGTSNVYKITDPYSLGAANPKILPFVLFAGRYLLRDISSPDTGSHTITDGTSYAACYALRAGECRTDSAAGDRYVSVPRASGSTQCLTNQYEENAPCFFNASPAVGKIQQVRIAEGPDTTGAGYRMLSNAFVGIGGEYQFSAPKMSPDGSWMFVPCWWLNGVRSEICGVQVPPSPPDDTIQRNNYVPYQVTLSGQLGDQVRVCWGYAENGPVDGSPSSLYPTPRRERGCVGAGGAEPFQWESETQQWALCDSSCSLTLKLIPGRVAYYVIERRNGSTVTRSNVHVAAIN
ncbi:MAG: hypothetical protein IT167_18295 [Bryobacterales bacterium]|nr:hypothetical protein [Bryobacterales bacterium]